MDILEELNTTELVKSLKEAVAKSRSEIRCAERDLKTVKTRLEFVMIIVSKLENRD